MARTNLSAQVAAQALVIEELRAALAAQLSITPPAQPVCISVSPDANWRDGHNNVLGTKAFARPILELIKVEADWRDDNEAARGLVLDHATCVRRARAWAFERRAYWSTQFGGPIAISQPEFVTAISGQWPSQFGDKVSGTYFAIY